MQRKGCNVVNKTGYKRNGKGKKKRARKEIEINSPPKKVQWTYAKKKNACRPLRPGSDAELVLNRT